MISDGFNIINPVEADKYLKPNEPRFIDFGHGGKGNLDLRVFLQDVYWVDTKGEPFLLEDMTEEYLTNVLNILFANAEYHYRDMAIWYAIELRSIGEGYINPDWEYVEKVKNIAASLILETPHEWLRETDLVKKILALLELK